MGVLVVGGCAVAFAPARTVCCTQSSEELGRRKFVWNSYMLMLGGTQETFVSMMW
jgi:hypothetical protein